MSAELETCANCQRSIGQLEQVYVWKEKPVCAECLDRLKGDGTKTPSNFLPLGIIVIGGAIILSAGIFLTVKYATGRDTTGTPGQTALSFSDRQNQVPNASEYDVFVKAFAKKFDLKNRSSQRDATVKLLNSDIVRTSSAIHPYQGVALFEEFWSDDKPDFLYYAVTQYKLTFVYDGKKWEIMKVVRCLVKQAGLNLRTGVDEEVDPRTMRDYLPDQ